MALDIHRLEKGAPHELLFSINSAALEVLAPGFERFRRSTGLTIDPYKDLKLSSGLGPLIRALQDSMPVEPHGAAVFNELLRVLSKAEASGYGIIFVGD